MAASRKKKDTTSKAAEAATVSTAPSTVTVAYNHPRPLKFYVTDNTGAKQSVTINGNATFLKGLPKGVLPTGGQYGITTGIPAELWDAVVAKYGNMPAFKTGLIITTNSKRDAEKEAAKASSVRNGFEPIDPNRSQSKPSTAEE